MRVCVCGKFFAKTIQWYTATAVCMCECEWKENREAAFPVSARDQKRRWKVGDDDDVIYIYRENTLPCYYIIILLEPVGEQRPL